ncbi:class A beta-lactamase-related serine hydrolase [Microbacterium laevaniformans]|uniref:Class A beta-lactamase-related serine hydrolase n=1 Tax=Microbacterium laevaniformans TaxID=36807 RepID=A0A4S2D9F5_9MICO|nr:serine hydrolase domain-containing protein [Microbacterium laevaniformans]TGY38398.1 class A beta-lactamase-related serine hydrolase [Microbacterium laevaniformans]
MRALRRSRRLAAMAGTLALALALAACSSSQTVSLPLPDQVDAAIGGDVQAQLQTAVERAVAASGASGAIVGVRVPWAGVWDAGVGTVAPGGAAVNDSMTFHAGAVTRSMTCDVLYGLVHDGVVSLDDPVGTYVTGLGDQGARDSLTLGQLCDSTSGIGAYDPTVDARMRATPSRVWTPRELMAFGMSQASNVQPGTVFADSDTGYVLLGFALERATSKTAAQLYQQYVFGPNGMTSTSLPDNGTAELNGLWTGNAADGSAACTAPTPIVGLSSSAGFTASGVISDLADMGRYVQALAMGLRPYDAPGRFENPLPAVANGPSWFTARGGSYQAGSLIGQYGSVPGALTAAFADRTTGMSVVVTLNNSRASADLVRSLAWELAAIASKAPAAAGRTAPQAGLPWTAEDMAAQVTAAAVCPIP